jgi:hypothetical protein
MILCITSKTGPSFQSKIKEKMLSKLLKQKSGHEVYDKHLMASPITRQTSLIPCGMFYRCPKMIAARLLIGNNRVNRDLLPRRVDSVGRKVFRIIVAATEP